MDASVGSNFQLLFDTIDRQPSRKAELKSLIDYQHIDEPMYKLDTLLLGTHIVARLMKRDLWRSFVFRVELYAVDNEGNATQFCAMTSDDDIESQVPLSTTSLRVKMIDTSNGNKILVWKLFPLVVPCAEVCDALPYRIRGIPVPAEPTPPTPPTAFEQMCIDRENAIKREFAARVHGAKVREQLRKHPEFALLDGFQQGQTLDSVDRAFDPSETLDEGN
ncbi:MAG: hypothetical protein KatS3mg104_1809 [Phycisphaerae bacterium]|jgi:hypothetical protein|nr:MAG: hypothetical protein KatS3mg104_1809 [Phycisphaerae bacterium]